MRKLISKSILLLTGFLSLTACDKYMKISMEEAGIQFSKMLIRMSDKERAELVPDQFTASYTDEEYLAYLENGEYVDIINETYNTQLSFDVKTCVGHIKETRTYFDVAIHKMNIEYWLYLDGGVVLASNYNNTKKYFKWDGSSFANKQTAKNIFFSLDCGVSFEDIYRIFFEAFITYTDKEVINSLKNDTRRKLNIVYKTKDNKSHLKLNCKTSLTTHDSKSSCDEVFEINNYLPLYNKTYLDDVGPMYDAVNEIMREAKRKVRRYWNLKISVPSDNFGRPDLSTYTRVDDFNDLFAAEEE